MDLPGYTEADIRQHASPDSFQRGREYYRSGAVASLVQRGMMLQAEVLGSDAVPRPGYLRSRPAARSHVHLSV